MAFLRVTDLTHLNALQIHEENEMAYVESEQQYYRWHEGTWEQVEIKGSGLTINLYDLNKSVMSQLPPKEVENYRTAFADFAASQKAHYYILFSFKAHYYTLFAQDPHEALSFEDALIEILEGFEGNIYSIELKEEYQCVEMWISMAQDEEPDLYILAPYDEGVVTFG